MSKVDAQRAMREARYAAMQAQTSPARRPAPAKKEPVEVAPVEPLPAASPPAQRRRAADRRTAAADSDAPSGLCGHRSSIGNKSCQREAGHAEKAHRYK